jgi:uncharacterized protein
MAAVNHGGDKPWTVSADGLVVTVRLTAKGGRDAIEGVMRLADGRSALKARVRAAASNGEANRALERLIARTLDIAPGHVALVGGATSRLKRLLIRGDASAAAVALERVEKAAPQ